MGLIRAIVRFIVNLWAPAQRPDPKNFGTTDPVDEQERDRRFISKL